MPRAVYIWKADDTVPATKTLRFVRGHNWWREEETGLTCDIMDYSQIDDTHVIYLVEMRPADWTGDGYLETVEVPYRMIRKDSADGGGTLERIGCWFRYIGAKEDIAGVVAEAEAAAVAAGLSLSGFSAGKKE